MDIKVLDREFVPYISATEIQERLKLLAKEIKDNMNGDIPIFIGVLNGSFMLVSDFMKYYDSPAELSFVKMSSYKDMKSTEVVTQVIGLNIDITDKRVIIIEDIVESGNTLVALANIFKELNPKKLEILTLCLKPDCYKKNLPIDYIGFNIGNKFIVGYGMDYNEYGRNIPEIYQLK